MSYILKKDTTYSEKYRRVKVCEIRKLKATSYHMLFYAQVNVNHITLFEKIITI